MRNAPFYLALALGLTLILLSCSKDEEPLNSNGEIGLRGTDDNPPPACFNCRIFLSIDDECNMTASLTKGCLGNVTFQWSTPNGTQTTPTVDASTNGKYCLHIFTDQGCWASACTMVENCEDVCTNDCIDIEFSSTLKCELVVNLDACEEDPTQIYWTVPMDYIPIGTTVTADTDGVYCAHVTFPDGCQYIECINIKDCQEFCEDNCTIEIDVDNSGAICTLDVVPTLCALNLEIEWTLPDGTTTTDSPIEATEDGTYCVVVTQPNGCEVSDCIDIVNCGIDCTEFELEWVDFQPVQFMYSDDGTSYFLAREYEKVGPDYEKKPIAYIAENGFQLSAQFNTTCPDLDKIFIRGTHTRHDGSEVDLPSKEIFVDLNGGIHYGLQNAMMNGTTFNFADTVEFNDPFEIVWEYSHDEIDWSFIHTSANPLYVTRNAWNPVVTNNIDPLHTYYRISCQAAEGLSLENEIIDAIWQIFVSKNFTRADGQALTYYGNWNTDVVVANELIQVGDGQCSSHSQAFLNCLKAQGINYDNDYLRVEAYQEGSQLGLLVKKFEGKAQPPGNVWAVDAWAPGGAPTGLPAGFEIEYVVVPKDSWNAGPENTFEPGNVHYSEIIDQNGLEGQNNPDPKAYFLNHQIVRIGSTHYDVPYGTTYQTLDEMKGNLFGYIFPADAIIDETILGTDANGDSIISSAANVSVWLIDRDMDNEVVLEEIPSSSF